MSDERFFSQVKSTLYNYSPEVPQAAYNGMRRKLWWSNFTKLSAGRMNMWYLLLLLGIGSTSSVLYFGKSASAEKSMELAAPHAKVSPIGQFTTTHETQKSTDTFQCGTAACCSASQSKTTSSSKQNENLTVSGKTSSATATSSTKSGDQIGIVPSLESNNTEEVFAVSETSAQAVSTTTEVTSSAAPLESVKKNKRSGDKGLVVKCPEPINQDNTSK